MLGGHLRGGEIHVAAHDGRALPGQSFRPGPTDPPTGSRHQRRLPREPRHHIPCTARRKIPSTYALRPGRRTFARSRAVAVHAAVPPHHNAVVPPRVLGGDVLALDVAGKLQGSRSRGSP